MHQRRVTTWLPRIALGLVVAALATWSLVPSSAATRATGAAPLTQLHPFTITSPDFTDGGPLPLSAEVNGFGCHGQNIAPTLQWDNVPAGTESFAFETTDYDAPIAGGFHHWIVYNIPADARTLTGSSPFTLGTNSFGTLGYGGPCPPPTGQLHHYIFTLYALTISHIAGNGLTYDQLIAAISGHVAGATVIVGTFVRTSPSQ